MGIEDQNWGCVQIEIQQNLNIQASHILHN